MAEEWSCPPWVIEERAPAIWVDRWLLLRAERAKVEERQAEDPQRGHQ